MKQFIVRSQVLFILLIISSLQAQTFSGSGTLLDPYQIKSQADLEAMRNHVNAYIQVPPGSSHYEPAGNTYKDTCFKLMNDITLTGMWTSIGDWGINIFQGTFDGNGKTIRNLQGTGARGGLFGIVGEYATIKNLTIDGGTLSGGADGAIGAMICQIKDSIKEFNNCHVKNMVITGKFEIGALIGSIEGNATLTNVSCEGTHVTVTDNVAGSLVGIVKGNLTLKEAHYNTSSVGNIKGISGLGGLVGYVQGNATLNNVSYKGQRIEGQAQVGGIVGRVGGLATVTNATYTGGDISGSEYLGGIIGHVEGDLVMDDAHYNNSLGVITGQGIMGCLVGGVMKTATIKNSSGNGSVYGTIDGSYGVGGLIGAVFHEAYFENLRYENGKVFSTSDNTGGIAGYVALAGNSPGVPNPVSIIKSCRTESAQITGRGNVGGLVGIIGGKGVVGGNIIVEDCHSDADVLIIDTATSVFAIGGLIGVTYGKGLLDNVSHTNGDINGYEIVGGIIGEVYGDTTIIRNAIKTRGTLRTKTIYQSSLGGIIGFVHDVAIIESSECTADIETMGNLVGGIVGCVQGNTSIKDVTYRGNIFAHRYVGGIVGKVEKKLDIDNAHSVSNIEIVNHSWIITDIYAGGICGSVDSLTTIKNSSHNGNIAPAVDRMHTSDYFGGIVGFIGDSAILGNTSHHGNIAGTDYIGGAVGKIDAYVYANGITIGTNSISSQITGSNYVGGLLGYIDGKTTVEASDSYSIVTLSGDHGGGMCGNVNDTTTIISSSHTGNIIGNSSSSNLGGIAGGITGALTLNTVNHTGNITGYDNLGGFVGNVAGIFTVTGSSVGASGNNSTITGRNNIGGFAGYVNGETNIGTSDSYSNINLSGNYGGGLCGSVAQKTEISQSSHLGTVMAIGSLGDYLGGVVGTISGELTLNNTSHSGNITGKHYIGGLVGNVGSTCNITGSITNNTVMGNLIKGSNYVGGLIGKVDGVTTITSAACESDIILNQAQGGTRGGGLCGYVDKQITVIKSSHTGSVSGNSKIGGVVGEINADFNVDEVSHTGNVTGGDYIGGFGGHIAGGVSFVNTSSCNAVITSTGINSGGLFGWIEGSCYIQKKSFFSGKVKGTDYVGGFIGRADGQVAISEVGQEADSISGQHYIGGFIGIVNGTTTIDSANVKGRLFATGNYIGGMVGQHAKDNLTIKKSYYEGDTIKGENNIGGFVGFASSPGQTILDSCYTHVNNILATGSNVGGLVGNTTTTNTLRISNSFNDGDRINGKGAVKGQNYVGGLIGQVNNSTTIIQSGFNRSRIEGVQNIGGLLGGGGSGTNVEIAHSYNTGTVSGTSGVGGIVGRHANIKLHNIYNIGIPMGSSNVGSITGFRGGTMDTVKCYTVHCAADNTHEGYEGMVLYADSLSTQAFANSLGSPFRYVQYSLPKLPMTNHLFVGVVSDTADTAPINCVSDISKGGSYTLQSGIPIRRLTDNTTRIAVYDKQNPNAAAGKKYTLSNITIDHLIAPVYAKFVKGNSTTQMASCGKSNGKITINYTADSYVNFQYSYSKDNGTTWSAWANMPNSSPLVINNIAAGTYTIKFQDEYGFGEDIEPITNVVVEVDPSTTITVTATDKICYGESTGTVILTPTGGTIPYKYYSLQGSNWVENATSLANQFNGLATGSHTFKVKDSQECEEELTYTLTAPTTNVTVSASTTTPCISGSTGVISLTASGGNGASYQYGYSTNDGSTWTIWKSFSGTDTTITGLPAGTYLLRVRDKSECVSPVSATVAINTLPSAPVLKSTINVICAGEPITELYLNSLFTPVSGVNNEYYDNVAGTNGTTFPIVATTPSRVFYVRAKSTGCQSTTLTTLTLTVNALPIPTITDGLATSCVGQSVTYTSGTVLSNYTWVIEGGTLGTDYTKTDGGSVDNSVTLTWKTPKTYTVKLSGTNAAGCASTVTASSSTVVNALPLPTITGGAITSCVGQSVTYTSGTVLSNYTWVIEGGTLGTDYTKTGGGTTDNRVTLTWKTPKTYTVKLSGTNADGCASIVTASSNTVVHALPVPTIVQTVDTICVGQSVTYTTESGMNNYIWTIPGTPGTDYTKTGGTPTNNTATITWLTGGNKSVSVNYTNTNNCTASSSTSVSTTVFELPLTPVLKSGTDTSVCSGTILTEILLQSMFTEVGDVTYNFYSDALGTSASELPVTTNYATSPSHIFYVRSQSTTTDCESSVASIYKLIIEVLPLSDSGLITITGDVSICSGSTATLTASAIGVTNPVFSWYKTPIGGTPFYTGASYTTGRLSTDTTFYVSVKGDNYCEGSSTGARKEVNVNINCYKISGTVFPFVHMGQPASDKQFVTIASLYALPTGIDPFTEIRTSTPLHIDTLSYYDETVYIQGTPKYPGSIGSPNNPGIPINWSRIGKITGEVNNTKVLEGEKPHSPVGFYTFENVAAGEYLLVISRPGFLTRYAQVDIRGDGSLGHRELLAGDVNDDKAIDSKDLTLLNENRSRKGEPSYNVRYDLNGDNYVDYQDADIILEYLRGNFFMYTDSNDWFNNYYK